jgi:hypothetical protein
LFNIELTHDLQLFTVFNYSNNYEEIDALTNGQKQLLEQRSQMALQLVLSA